MLYSIDSHTRLNCSRMSAPFHYLAGYVYRRFGLFDQAEMEFLNTQVFAKEVPLMQVRCAK